MDLYSPTLGLAMATAALALGAAVAAWLAARRSRPEAGGAARRLARHAGVASLALVSFSALYHLGAGHRPGTAGAMAAAEFVREHPALVLSALLAAVALLSAARRPG